VFPEIPVLENLEAGPYLANASKQRER